jgi:predicted dehydrogenase
MVAHFSFDGADVQGSTDVSFLRGPSGIPTSTAVVHGTNGSIKLTNFLVPFLKRGNSIVVRAADGTVVSKVMLTDRRSTFEHQMTAFARQVHEVTWNEIPNRARCY